jgi:hypothetical protein
MTHRPGTVAVFDPQQERRLKPGTLPTPRQLLAALFRFYRTPGSRLALIITSVLLCYGGGLLMFWFHSVALGEGGPNISWYSHWLLDSTFGFIGLTPVLFVLLPLASWMAQRVAGPGQAPWTWVYVGTVTGLFSLATVPGPIAHDNIVGRGTWMAAQVTQMIGDPTAPPHPRHVYPIYAELTQQLGAAVPIYLALTTLSVLVVRRVMALRRRDVQV